jgi:hypothetical protein
MVRLAALRLYHVSEAPRRGRLSAAVSAMVVSRLSPELSKRADAEPKVLRRASHMSVMHWDAILISAEWPFS